MLILYVILICTASLHIYKVSINSIEPNTIKYPPNITWWEKFIFSHYKYMKFDRIFIYTFVLSCLTYICLIDRNQIQLTVDLFHSIILITLFLCDRFHKYLPNIITIPAIIIEIIIQYVYFPHNLHFNLILALIIFGILFIFYKFTKGKSIGGGDIKTILFLTIWLGLLILPVILISSLTSMIYTLYKKRRIIPYGPHLIIATLLVTLFTQQIYDFIVIFLQYYLHQGSISVV